MVYPGRVCRSTDYQELAIDIINEAKSRAEGTTEDRLLLNLELLIHFREEGSRLYSEIQVIPSIDDTLA